MAVGAAVAAVAVTASVALAADKPKSSGMMTMDTGAKLTVVAPKNGAIIRGNVVHAKVAISNFRLAAGLAGTPDKAGVGHYHIELDGSLVDMYGSPSATISLQNVAPGKHTLTFLPATNEHMDDMKAARKVTFTYQPSAPLPAIGARTFSGKPAVTILEPKPGSTVSGSFEMKVATTNFALSKALFGKANVPGYGHWHVNVDSTTKGMMGMGTMMGMSGTPTFHVSLAGVKPGKHRFWAVLVDNTHAPTIGVMKSVTVTVK
jgi:hypothetical protein